MAETKMAEQVKSDIQRLTDVFSGADGGCDFVMFRGFIESTARKVDTGNPPEEVEASKQLCDILHKCRRLIDVGTRQG